MKSRHTFIGRLPLSGFVVSLVQVREAGSHLEDSRQRCDVKLAYCHKYIKESETKVLLLNSDNAAVVDCGLCMKSIILTFCYLQRKHSEIVGPNVTRKDKKYNTDKRFTWTL